MKRGLRFSVAVNAGIKVLALIVSFLSTPLMMSFFSNEAVLGAWFTILSVLNWISFFDDAVRVAAVHESGLFPGFNFIPVVAAI